MSEKPRGDVQPREKHGETTNQPGFFELSDQEVREKYREPADDYNRKRGIEFNFKLGELRQELTTRFDTFLKQNGGQIPQKFFDDTLQLAREYKALELGHCENFHNNAGALKSSQLGALIQHPEFIKDPGCVAIMEELADLEYAEPWNFNMYVNYDHKGKKGYQLREGFGSDHLPTFQKLIDDPKLWQGKSSEMRRVFFASVSEAIMHMTENNPSETLPLRLKLLEYNIDYGDNCAEIRQSLVYTFKSEEDRKALEKIMQERPASKVGKEAEKILSGKYDRTLWAT